ncbi:MAG: hypothetical protein ACM3S3_03285 [Candidatus Doudnabacteria bacterium]|jgi:hypothetical protein
MWHQKNRVGLSFCALALAAVVAAGALLAFATGGNAASSNACTQTGPTANCVVVSVAPIVLSTNKVGVAAVKFKNVFNKATATHTVVALDLPDGITLATPAGTAISSSPAVTCSEQTVSCNFGSVPGGATVTMYVTFTTALPAGSTVPNFVGTASFDESNGNTGTTTNDSFSTSANPPVIGAEISPDGHGANQAGLCTSDLSQTAFTTNAGGQQVNVSTLPAIAQGGLPCTPVAAGVRDATADEANACGGSCPTPISFVFFPILNGNAKATVLAIFPTIPSTVSSWQKTPLFELLGTGTATTSVQVANCGAPKNPSPDTCISNLSKFGSQGVQFTLSVAGSPFDGRYTP